jgi:hypothetical protein
VPKERNNIHEAFGRSVLRWVLLCFSTSCGLVLSATGILCSVWDTKVELWRGESAGMTLVSYSALCCTDVVIVRPSRPLATPHPDPQTQIYIVQDEANRRAKVLRILVSPSDLHLREIVHDGTSERFGLYSFHLRHPQHEGAVVGKDADSIYSCVFPAWALLVGAIPFFIPLIAASLFVLRRRQRSRSGRCPYCGYDLTGNTTGICPECGTKRPTPHPAAATGPIVRTA